MNWLRTASIEQRMIMAEWTEYLCIRSSSDGAGWEIAICGHDDEGELLPMTDDSVASISELSDEFIGDAIATIGWQGTWDMKSIVAACLL